MRAAEVCHRCFDRPATFGELCHECSDANPRPGGAIQRDPHCGYNPSNCPYGDACADCQPPAASGEEDRS